MHALVSIICASILLQVLITMCNNKNVYVYLSAFVSSNHILLPGCVSAPIVASLRREMSACKYIIDVGVLNTFVWMLTNLFLLLGVWKENFFLIKTCFVLFFVFIDMSLVVGMLELMCTYVWEKKYLRKKLYR